MKQYVKVLDKNWKQGVFDEPQFIKIFKNRTFTSAMKYLVKKKLNDSLQGVAETS